MVTKSPCTKNQNMYHNMYQNFSTYWWCTKNNKDMYQNILVHGYFWYTGARVPKKWYILHRVPKNTQTFWYTVQYVLKNWYTNLYTEQIRKYYVFWYTLLCVPEYFGTRTICINIFGTYWSFLIHIDVFSDMYSNMYHFFGTRFWYTEILVHEQENWSTEKVKNNR